MASGAASQAVDSVASSHADAFIWTAHPARERVNHALLAAIAMFAMAGAVYVSFQSVAWAVASLVVLVFALNRFYFPSSFTIDRNGVTAKYPLRRKHISWNRLRRFVHDDHGAYLSTRAAASRLDAYRGIHLLFGTQRDQVLKHIRSKMRSGSDHE